MMVLHRCDGENDWCDDCEAREKANDQSGDWDMHALDAGYEEFPHDE